MSAPAGVAASLAVEGLALSFGGNHVLQNIAVNFAPGEITGLIGPNGAGKTSFFNCLTGLYSPQKGRISLGEQRVEKMLPPERSALGFSRSFQHVALCPELTVLENVVIGLHRHSKAGWLDAFLPCQEAARSVHATMSRPMPHSPGWASQVWPTRCPHSCRPGCCVLQKLHVPRRVSPGCCCWMNRRRA